MSQTLEEIDTGKVIQARDMIDIEFRKIGLRLKTGPVPDSMFGLPIEVRDNERYSYGRYAQDRSGKPARKRNKRGILKHNLVIWNIAKL